MEPSSSSHPRSEASSRGGSEPDWEERLVAEARRASERAYCPYSQFAVGAAVLTEAGAIYTGCNVENASYGLTICAERAALARTVVEHQGPDALPKIVAVAVYTPTDQPTPPCGACRQVIFEFGSQVRILAVCRGPQRIRTTIDQLLPGAFGPSTLRDNQS
jgi:cytidine deaminase